ncbi:MAG: NAD-dependent epimerase/dehydratase family protein [Patescibacteria group bacterium]|nr:NAD-dependent epimerase/dehydratase family protein [Patescibacteria group bacterium]MDE2590929.1 NAD-dependent epimerase/dehydratase family protein [Patescibacteria group bacterium]
MKSPTIFITGASGFVGANIARACIKKGYQVHILLRDKKHIWRLEQILPKLTVHQGSLLDQSSLKRIFRKIQPEFIFHLAANGAYSTQNDLEKIIATNIEGTKNLLLASADIPYSCFVNTGTSSEYGFKNKPMKETDSCNPVSYYAFTKLAATQMCKIFAVQHNKPIITFRLFSAYGPFEEPARFVPTIVKNLFTKAPIQLTPGKQRRDFVYITDVVNAYLSIIKRTPKLQGEIINLGTGREYTNDEVVHHLFKVTKEKTPVEKGTFPKRTWDTSHWVASRVKAAKLLDWKPKFTLDKGLADMYAWYAKNRHYYEKV